MRCRRFVGGGYPLTSFGVVAIAGLLSGVLDLTATSTLLRLRGMSLEKVLQFIASGALGASAFKGGRRTALAGLFFHFCIAFIAAAVYFAASRALVILVDHPFLCGALYGVAVHLFMSLIVVPLSAAPKREFSMSAFLTQFVIHILVVGLPIALTVAHFSRN